MLAGARRFHEAYLQAGGRRVAEPFAELLQFQRVEEAGFRSTIEAEVEAFEQVLVLLRRFHQQAQIGLVGLAQCRKLVGDGFPVRKGCGIGAHDHPPESLSSWIGRVKTGCKRAGRYWTENPILTKYP